MTSTPQSTKHGDLRDAAWVQARTEEVLSQPLYWFPVRHHSPTVAEHVEKAILTRRPAVIFLEGPSEAADLIPFVTDSQTKPPVAIYSSFRDDDNVLGLAGIASPSPDVPTRLACWYPLLAYSPEYVAMAAAKKVGAEVVLMDLPHFAAVTPHVPHLPSDECPPAAETDAPLETPAAPTSSDERLITCSGFYRALAETAGFRSWNEAWDTMFELSDPSDTEAFRRELATFCCAVRGTLDPALLAADGTLARERFMWQTIRQTLESKRLAPAQAMVVCGGLHLFLDQNDPTPPPPIPSGTVYTSIVPYSFFRISELSGYAAGNRAPQYYQTVWELRRAGRRNDLLAEHTVATLRKARREGEVVSSADAIAVSQHARMLASLRGRSQPVLEDLHDALVTCCCKGDPNDVGIPLLKAIDAADIGTKIGKVTDKLGKLPIVRDFYYQVESAGLEASLSSETRTTLMLDLRQEADQHRSVLLHRLAYLKIPFAVKPDAGAPVSAGLTMRERWQVQWSPRVEPALVEQNLYGDTLEAAALARLREELARDELHAGRVCRLLAQALGMDLPDMVQQVEEGCQQAIDTDTRFVSLSEALHWLTVIQRHAAYRELRRDALDELVRRCYDRACFAVPEVANVPEDQEASVISALLTVAELVLRDGQTYDRALFAQHVGQAAKLSAVPRLRGAFLGLLSELRVVPSDTLAGEITVLAKAAPEQMITAGDFIDGVMAVSRTSIMLEGDALVAAIDELLQAADWDTFLVMLPRMRAAFERLHARQRESLATRVAERYGLGDKPELLTELRTSVGAAAWIARIDSEVDKIMHEWGF